MSKSKEISAKIVATNDDNQNRPTIECVIGWSTFCKKDIGPSPKNPNIYDGFLDKNLNYFVCNDCKKEFYQGKNEGVFGSQHIGKYTEFPVNVPPATKANNVKPKSSVKNESKAEPFKKGDFFFNSNTKRLMKVNAMIQGCTCPLFNSTKKTKPHIHINADDLHSGTDAHYNHYYENEAGEIVHLERDDKLILVKEPIKAVIQYLDATRWTIVWENCPHNVDIIKSGIKTGYLAENFCKEHDIEFRKSYEPITKSPKASKQNDNSKVKTPITGIHGCSCHPFSSWAESNRYHKQKFQVGDQVKNRHNGKLGEVYEINEAKGYYNVKYGINESDKTLNHAAELELIAAKVVATKSKKTTDPNEPKSELSETKLDKFLTKKPKKVTDKPKTKVEPRTEMFKFRLSGCTRMFITRLTEHLGLDSSADTIHYAIKKLAESLPEEFNKNDIDVIF